MRVTRLCAAGTGALLVFVGVAAVTVRSQQPKIGYDDTPMQPNGKWHIHDGTRPQPRIVTPGTSPGAAPVGCDGAARPGRRWQRLEDEHRRKRPDLADEGWDPAVRQGHDRNQGAVHGFPAPRRVRDAEGSQGRRARDAATAACSCSGVFEVQVLDSYNNKTYPDGQASAMYGQYPAARERIAAAR